MNRAYRRSGRMAALIAVAGLGAAACGGSGSPHVASLGDSGGHGGATTTTLPKGNPSQLLDEWAGCMRNNGYPDTVDPTIDANKVIHITIPASANSGSGPVDFRNNVCGVYLTAASTALRGGKPLQKPDPAKLEKFSRCMRANGIPDFPDPNGQGLQLQSHPGSDLSPNNPTFQTASKKCAKQAGVPAFGSGSPGPGAIEATGSAGSPQGGPGGNGGSGGIQSSGGS